MLNVTDLYVNLGGCFSIMPEVGNLYVSLGGYFNCFHNVEMGNLCTNLGVTLIVSKIIVMSRF